MRKTNRSIAAGALTLPLLLGGAGLASAETTVDQDARYNSEDGASAEVDVDNGQEDEEDGLLGLGILNFGDDEGSDDAGEDAGYTEDDGVLGGVL